MSLLEFPQFPFVPTTDLGEEPCHTGDALNIWGLTVRAAIVQPSHSLAATQTRGELGAERDLGVLSIVEGLLDKGGDALSWWF